MKTILFLVLLTLPIFSEPDNGLITHEGEGTYYNDGLLPNCSFPLDERPLYHGAMNKTEYDDSKVCGSYVTVTGPNGSVEILIDNQCPECAEGDIDLSEEAFVMIADKIDGRVDISWKYTEGPSSPIKYQLKDGSNRWHVEILVKNLRYAIRTLEIQVDDNWINLTRADYNYFVYDGDIGASSIITLRATDINDQQIIDVIDAQVDLNSNLPSILTITGEKQFPSLDSTTAISNDFSTMAIGGNKVKVAPSPISHNANVIFTIKKAGKVELSIFTTTNEKVASQVSELKAGDNYVIDDWAVFETLQKGTYFIELKLNNRRVGLFQFYKI